MFREKLCTGFLVVGVAAADLYPGVEIDRRVSFSRGAESRAGIRRLCPDLRMALGLRLFSRQRSWTEMLAEEAIEVAVSPRLTL